MAATPPPAQTPPPPPAPRHGPHYDNWPPPSGVRKSVRLAVQRSARTPSPPSLRTPGPASPSGAAEISPKRPRPRGQNHSLPPPSSPDTTPRKRARISAADATEDDFSHLKAPATKPSSLLLTPAKTPRKKDVDLGQTSSAKALFPRSNDPIEEMTPSRRRGRGRGRREPAQEPIQIYTDSQDRLPEVDDSIDNPFYIRPGTEGAHAASLRKYKKGGRDPEVHKDIGRDDGHWVMFRGKKFWSTNDKDNQDLAPGGDASLMEGMLEIDDSDSPRRSSRRAVQPRFLFGAKSPPTDGAAAAGSTDEEALTDIEVPRKSASPSTPVKPAFSSAITPVTPPTTGRATRSTAKIDSDGLDMGLAESARPDGNRSLGQYGAWDRGPPPPHKGRNKREARNVLPENNKRVRNEGH